MPDKDASKRAKNVQAEGEKTAPITHSASTVPMQTACITAAPSDKASTQADMYVRAMAKDGQSTVATDHFHAAHQTQCMDACHMQAAAAPGRPLAAGPCMQQLLCGGRIPTSAWCTCSQRMPLGHPCSRLWAGRHRQPPETLVSARCRIPRQHDCMSLQFAQQLPWFH